MKLINKLSKVEIIVVYCYLKKYLTITWKQPCMLTRKGCRSLLAIWNILFSLSNDSTYRGIYLKKTAADLILVIISNVECRRRPVIRLGSRVYIGVQVKLV